MPKYIVAVTVLASALLATAPYAQAQRLQPGEIRLTIGSWKGTAEVDAFTKKEKIIISTERRSSGVVLRCMDGQLSIGWFEGGLASGFDADATGELSLRIDDDVVGPIAISAINKHFAAARLSQANLDRIAKATKEIGYKIMLNDRGSTGGLGALKTADVAARLKRSCSGDTTISPANKERIAPSGEGKIEEKAN
jgi:hypothetical protein